MTNAPDELRQRLCDFGQEHVLAGWDRLTEAKRENLLGQLKLLDLQLLKQLYDNRDQPIASIVPEEMEAIPVVSSPSPDDSAARALGEAALRRGEVAVLLVAGGQGSRLGFDHPKGMYPVGPISRKSLFQIHAEKVLALRRGFGAIVPLLVMTSPATHAETVQFFEQNQFFALGKEVVSFFEQGTMPALDLTTGRLLLEAPGQLFLSPDGHGGSLTALAKSGLLDRLRKTGVHHLFYFQVDNPLVRIADPVFLGHHIGRRSEVSSKVIAKEAPKEKLGNFVQVRGRCAMIEYSDLPDKLAEKRTPDGRLLFWAGNPAIHIFDLGFLESVSQGASAIPFHVARKKVPYLDENGHSVQPTKENALKFERFIFDVLPRASRWLLVETSRREEFAPLKNADGPDSPATVERELSELAAYWLTNAGVSVPRQPDGSAKYALEISPLLAMDGDELASKISPSLRVDGPRYFE